MDPVMILGARNLNSGTDLDDIDAFYQRHGFDAAAPMRRLRRYAHDLRRLMVRGERFGVRHPAE